MPRKNSKKKNTTGANGGVRGNSSDNAMNQSNEILSQADGAVNENLPNSSPIGLNNDDDKSVAADEDAQVAAKALKYTAQQRRDLIKKAIEDEASMSQREKDDFAVFKAAFLPHELDEFNSKQNAVTNMQLHTGSINFNRNLYIQYGGVPLPVDSYFEMDDENDRSIERLPWVGKELDKAGDSKGYKVDTACLAAYIRKHHTYYWIQDDVCNEVEKFFYNPKTGIFDMSATNRLSAWINQFIPELINKSAYAKEITALILEGADFIDRLVRSDFVHGPRGITVYRDGVLALKDQKHPENGIDYKAGALMPFSPLFHRTWRIDRNWKDMEKAKPVGKFEAFQREFCAGNEEEMFFDRQWMAAIASDMDISDSKIVVVRIGKKDSGKTIMAKLLAGLIGYENVVFITFNKLLSNNFSMSRIIGKRYVVSDELGNQIKEGIEMLKSFSGGTVLEVEEKFQRGRNARFFGSTEGAGNKMFLYGKDDAATDRLVIRNTHGVPKVINEHLVREILEEEGDWLAYQLAMLAIEMYAKPARERFNIPQTSIDAREEHRVDTDNVRAFLRDCCTIRESFAGHFVTVNKADFWDIYHAYVNKEHEGRGLEKKGEFRDSLMDMKVYVHDEVEDENGNKVLVERLVLRKDGTEARMGDYKAETKNREHHYTHIHLNKYGYKKYHNIGRQVNEKQEAQAVITAQINANPPQASPAYTAGAGVSPPRPGIRCEAPIECTRKEAVTVG